MSLFDTIEDLNSKYSLAIEFAGIFMTRVAGRTTLYKQMFESYENMFGENSFLFQSGTALQSANPIQHLNRF